MDKFPSAEDLCALLKGNGFEVEWIRYSPSYFVNAYLSWRQFFSFVLQGRGVNHDYFLPQYVLLSSLDWAFHRRVSGSVIIGARLVA